MITKLRTQQGQMHRRRGQSIVEFALGSILLVMLLATALDMGRAFFTWQVVHNMAAEGAAYLSRWPDKDTPPSSPDSYQGRVMNVGQSAGRIFNPNNVDPTNDITAVITWTSSGTGVGSTTRQYRCLGNRFKVTVDYAMTDLFIPAFFGVQSLNLGAEETSAFLANTQSAGNSCTP
jgi:Flp pilus assembly protein TadG